MPEICTSLSTPAWRASSATPFGGPHMDGLKCIFRSLHVAAYGISDSPGTADSTGDRALVIYVCVERHEGAVIGSR